MEIELSEKPKNPIIIEGFPGYGLIGTIVTEFIIKHLNAKQIGKIIVPEIAPVVAVHNNQAVDPLGVFYDKKTNIVVIHALTTVVGMEWKLAEKVAELAKLMKAKEVLCIEGVGNPTLTGDGRTFYMGKSKKLATIKGLKRLDEGIIMGVTGALLLRNDIAVNCIFAETHSQLPDAAAAAKIVAALDDYLGLKIDYKPLLQQATLFEQKLKDLVSKSHESNVGREKNTQVYFG
ncbi:MAG TPA: PAC2 family protein [Candidatus Nanoarchaeia archaeon]|nr:PAC2 family protein [Candidatus Nanoarchaeia archaeon]